MKKTTFFVHIFDISPCGFTQITRGRSCWTWNLILHPNSTHTAYFWWIAPQKQEIHKKTWWWNHHHIFSGISCFWGSEVCHHHIFSGVYFFWGSGVHQKYVVWVLVGCGIKFYIQQSLPLEIWVKTHGDMSKIRTKK